MIIDYDPLHPPAGTTRTIGAYTVEFIPLAHFRMDTGGLFGIIPKKLVDRVYPHSDEQNRLPLVSYAMLVRGPGIVLVADSGIGDKVDEKTLANYAVQQPHRVLPRALAARGIAPEDVTHFVYTHLHFDHAGGATEIGEDGKLRPVFPRARYLVQSSQIAWARRPSEKDRATYDPANWEPAQDAGLIAELDGDHTIAPGLELCVVHGHTTGLQMVLVHSESEGLLHSVDLFPTTAHIAPHYVPAYDNHPVVSVEEKKDWLEQIHARGWDIFFGHDPFTPPVKVHKNEKGQWAFTPPNL